MQRICTMHTVGRRTSKEWTRNTFCFSSGLQSNTKARNAAVHYKQLLAVGPEILHSERRKDTALPRPTKISTTKRHFPHLQCSQAKYLQIKFGGAKPDDLNDTLSSESIFSETNASQAAVTNLRRPTKRPGFSVTSSYQGACYKFFCNKRQLSGCYKFFCNKRQPGDCYKFSVTSVNQTAVTNFSVTSASEAALPFLRAFSPAIAT